MHIIIAALIALLVGIAVKFALSVFETARPYADAIALVVAVLFFLHEIGVF